MKNNPKTDLSIEDVEQELRLLKQKISDSIEEFNARTGLVPRVTIDYEEMYLIGGMGPGQYIPQIDAFVILKM